MQINPIEHKKLLMRNWKQKNKEHLKKLNAESRERCKEHKNSYNKKYIQNIKYRVMQLYGGKCVVCGETELYMLSIDHKNDDGAKDIGGASFYRQLLKSQRNDLQCMCMSCQWRKRFLGKDFTKWPNYINIKTYNLAEYAQLDQK